MLSETWGRYTYSTSLGQADVTWGALASEAIGFLSRQPLDSLTLRTTSRGQVLVSGDVPVAADSFEALEPLVEEAIAKWSRQPRHPATIVFPHLEPGEVIHEPAREVRMAAEMLLGLLETNAERVSVVYGYINPLLVLIDPTPSWGGRMSGLRLPNDPHRYSLQAELGRFDLIRHDPATNQVLERTDVRSWDAIPSEIGEIKICRQSVNLRRFLDEISRLVEALIPAVDEVSTIRWEGSGEE